MVLGGPATQRGSYLQGEANSTEKHRLDSENDDETNDILHRNIQ